METVGQRQDRAREIRALERQAQALERQTKALERLADVATAGVMLDLAARADEAKVHAGDEVQKLVAYALAKVVKDLAKEQTDVGSDG